MQYNLLGTVVRKQLEESCIIAAEFHDNSRHRRRMAPIRANHGFTLAALSDAGAPAEVFPRSSKQLERTVSCLKQDLWLRAFDTECLTLID
jgi:hypothetical protein